MFEYSKKWHNGTSRIRSTKTFDGLAAIHAQLNNLGREIKKVNEKVYVAQVGCEQCKGPHYTKDCPLKEEVKRHEENSNMIKEIQASTDAAIQNQGALIKTLEIQIGQVSKVLQERGFGSLPSSIDANPRDHVKSISTTVEADINLILRIKSP
ncbi:putative reverse transcriptase, RNA-dependent DNA polymerase [Tanacetum coccineum]